MRRALAPGGSSSCPSAVWVGRERELARLRQSLCTPPSLVLVEGEAGVGKTRLVGEFLGEPEVGEQRVLEGHCPQMSEPFFVGAIIDALEGVEVSRHASRLSPIAGVLRPLLPETAAALPAQPPRSEDSGLERHRIFRALRELVEILTPAVLLLEDVHWADEASIEFVEFLCRQPPSGLTVVVTYRREELAADSPLLGLPSRASAGVQPEVISLAPLGWEEVRAMVAAFLGAEEVSAEFAQQLHEWTAGLPFAVEELLRLLHEREDLIRVGGTWARRELENLQVPPAVRGAVLERAGRLPADARALLDAAAVVGMPAGARLLGDVAGLGPDGVGDALDQTLARGLMIEVAADQFALRHALALQAIAEALSPTQRQRLHLRAAEALQAAGGEPAARLAHHYRLAHRPAEWGRYAEQAGDEARAATDDRGAMEFYQQALDVAPNPTGKARLAIKLGDAALFAGVPSVAAPLLRRVLDDHQHELSTEARGELRFSLAMLLHYLGGVGEWRELMGRAVGELEPTQPALAANAMSSLAMPQLVGGGLEENLAWLDHACETARQQDDVGVLTGVLATRAAVLLWVGDPRGWDAVEDIPARGASTPQALLLAYGYGALAGSALTLGYHQRGAAFLDAGQAILDELHSDRWRRWLATVRAKLEFVSGQWDGLPARLDELAGETESMPMLHLRSQLLRGSLWLARGSVDEAEAVLEPARTAAETACDAHGVIEAAAALARIRLLAGDPPAACRLVDGAVAAVRWKSLWAWTAELLPTAVEAHLAAGHPEQAAPVVEETAAGLSGRDAPAAHAALRTGQALIAEARGEACEAATAFAQAADEWAALPRPLEAARARAGESRARLAGGERDGEQGLLQALETFSALDARLDIARARQDLRAHGHVVPPSWRGGRRGYGDELSPREAEIARLAARGWTSQEIADRLFLSRRTVEGHVRAVLRKLGLGSKADLQRRDVDLPLPEEPQGGGNAAPPHA